MDEAEKFRFFSGTICISFVSEEKNSLECVLASEQTVQQFEESSQSSYPDEPKSATPVRCCHAKVREYLYR